MTRIDMNTVAPEVIEQSGATTASDIWSVGCTVIELLEGKPPYHFLDPMPALFRIVQDDCPPIPEGASPVVKDFLYHCFQKDPNLRISAKKLLKHPWMVASKRQKNPEKVDTVIAEVQQWNQALNCMLYPSSINCFIDSSLAPSKVLNHRNNASNQEGMRSPLQPLDFGPAVKQLSTTAQLPTTSRPPSLAGNMLRNDAVVNKRIPPATTPLGHIRETMPLPFILQQPEEQDDNWDDDFEEGISFTKLQGTNYPLGLLMPPALISPLVFSVGEAFWGRRQAGA